MYNETLYEVERVVQIKWVKSKSYPMQIGSIATSNGRAMMRDTTPGNPKNISPSVTTTPLPRIRMTQNIRRPLSRHLPTTNISITLAARNPMHLLKPSAILMIRRRRNIVCLMSLNPCRATAAGNPSANARAPLTCNSNPSREKEIPRTSRKLEIPSKIANNPSETAGTPSGN